jgi:membrane-associated phospholipid phosphatase
VFKENAVLKSSLQSIVVLACLVFPTALAFAEQQAPAEAQAPPQEDPAQVVTPEQTASSSQTVKKIFTNFGSDQKAIWTSPFHIRHDDAKWWALFGLGTAALIGTDRTTQREIPYSLTQIRFSTDVSRIGQEYVTIPIAGALYFYGRAKNDPKAREAGVLGAEALLDSGVVVTLLKIAGGRERPNQAGGNGRFFRGKGANASFPSGHAIATWTFASVMSHEYAPNKVVPIVAYGLATAVSVSRFTGQFHFASDILAGGAMGWFIGRFVWDHHQDPAIHKRYDPLHSRFMPQISPVVQLSTHAYGLNLSWTP